jgi:hypothetical protein
MYIHYVRRHITYINRDVYPCTYPPCPRTCVIRVVRKRVKPSRSDLTPRRTPEARAHRRSSEPPYTSTTVSIVHYLFQLISVCYRIEMLLVNSLLSVVFINSTIISIVVTYRFTFFRTFFENLKTGLLINYFFIFHFISIKSVLLIETRVLLHF